MKFDAHTVWANARQATTEDLLDRVTVFRQSMEPEALAIIGAELQGRGVTQEAIAAHGLIQEENCMRYKDGTVMVCSLCRKPAVLARWGWHRLWGVLPVFPRRFRYCAEHRRGYS
jgi:hypothetical protein